MKILLVEDGEDHARILIAVLKRNGFEVTWLMTGVDAFEYLSKAETPPDLLITDILMPGMTGFELIDRLKEKGIMPPTIVLTSREREEDVLRGLEFGVLDYLTKPFSPTVVVAKIKNVMARKAS